MVKTSDIVAAKSSLVMDYDQDDDAKSESAGSDAESETSTSRSASASRIGKESSSVDETIPMLARGETRAVKRLRWLTIGILLLVAGVCCASVFIYTRNVEKVSFDEEYVSNGLKVITAFQDDSFRKLDALHSLSNILTAYTLDENVTWPYFTLDSSAQILSPYLSLAGAACVTILPIVPADQRAEWEAYSEKEQGWIERDYKWRIEEQKQELESSARRLESVDVATSDRALREELDDSISPYIKNYVGIDLSNGPWFVWWHYAPVIKNSKCNAALSTVRYRRYSRYFQFPLQRTLSTLTALPPKASPISASRYTEALRLSVARSPSSQALTFSRQATTFL